MNYKHGLGNEVRRLFEDAIAPKIIPLRASFDKECFAKYIHFLSNYIHLYYKLCIVFTPPITHLCIFFVTFCVCVCVSLLFSRKFDWDDVINNISLRSTKPLIINYMRKHFVSVKPSGWWYCKYGFVGKQTKWETYELARVELMKMLIFRMQSIIIQNGVSCSDLWFWYVFLFHLLF